MIRRAERKRCSLAPEAPFDWHSPGRDNQTTWASSGERGSVHLIKKSVMDGVYIHYTLLS
jgi:hypothetical protein